MYHLYLLWASWCIQHTLTCTKTTINSEMVDATVFIATHIGRDQNLHWWLKAFSISSKADFHVFIVIFYGTLSYSFPLNTMPVEAVHASETGWCSLQGNVLLVVLAPCLELQPSIQLILHNPIYVLRFLLLLPISSILSVSHSLWLTPSKYFFSSLFLWLVCVSDDSNCQLHSAGKFLSSCGSGDWVVDVVVWSSTFMTKWSSLTSICCLGSNLILHILCFSPLVVVIIVKW